MQALRMEIQRQPSLLGNTVVSNDDVYRAFHPFIQQWRRGRRGLEGGPLEPYILTMDVSRAFDTINIGLLHQIIEPILREPRYHFIKYFEVCFCSFEYEGSFTDGIFHVSGKARDPIDLCNKCFRACTLPCCIQSACVLCHFIA